MFISLYTSQHLKQLKRNILMTGVFLAGGGLFALTRELLAAPAPRPEWFAAAVIVFAAGVACLAVGLGFIPLKDAYFLMNPSRLGYRLTLFGKEQILSWTEVQALRVQDSQIVFELRDEREVTMRLTTIPDEKVARHIRASISLAALEQNIKVNEVQVHPQKVIAS